MKIRKRICEWDEAVRMKEDGTLVAFLQSWIDRYGSPGGRLMEIKEYKDANNCTLKEAKEELDMSRYRPRPVDISFEIGADYILERTVFGYTLKMRVNGIWTGDGKIVDLKELPGLLEDPAKVRCESLCDNQQLRKAGRARKLGDLAIELRRKLQTHYYWERDKKYLFCDQEIWSEEEGVVRIDRKGGFEEIPATVAAMKAHLQKHYERLDPTREPF